MNNWKKAGLIWGKKGTILARENASGERVGRFRRRRRRAAEDVPPFSVPSRHRQGDVDTSKRIPPSRSLTYIYITQI